jgi:hypothetical protein
MNHIDEITVTKRNKGLDIIFKTTSYSHGQRHTTRQNVRIGMRGAYALLNSLLVVFKDKMVPHD